MSATRLGQVLFAVAIAVLGAFNLAWGDFSYVWLPLPKWLPGRVLLADLSGVMLVVLGIGMLLRRTARLATLLLTANMGIWLLLTKLPAVLAAPNIEVRWEQFGETTMLFAGGWSLLAALSRGGSSRRSWLDGPEGVQLARRVYALALPMMGLSHFFYLKFTASMIPGWIPFHVAFACLTGAGHIAAGLGLLFGVLPRLAATAEAVMISIFVLFANSAAVIAQPGSHDQWTEIFVAIAIAGAAWAVAGLTGTDPELASAPARSLSAAAARR